MSTTTELSENSHQGFEGLKTTLCQRLMEAKSNNASGLPVCLWQEGIGSRCSGKERDETNLDYFGARYFSGAMGRWTSPDPLLGSGRPSNPQSWNRYSYVLNNPIILFDPNGLMDMSTIRVLDEDYTEVYDSKNLKIDGKPSLYTVTIHWKARKVEVKGDDGKTRIKGSIAKEKPQATVTDINGNIDVKKSEEQTAIYSQYDNSSNCFGFAFANGQMWLPSSSINNVIKGDRYTRTDTPGEGDIGIYSSKLYDDKRNKAKGDLFHAVSVAEVDSVTNTVLGVTGKSGLAPNDSRIYSPGPGAGSAWPNNPDAELYYLTK